MTKTKSKKKRRRTRKSAAPPQILSTIVVSDGNVIQDPGRLICLPSTPVAWQVLNNDSASHVVSIDTNKIKHKNNNRFEHPFRGQPHLTSKRLSPGEHDVLWGMIDDPTAFKNSVEHYKYSIDSSGAGGTSTTLDPDLDVIEPTPRIFYPQGPDRPRGPYKMPKSTRYKLPGPKRPR